MKKNVPIYLFCFYALFIGAEVNAQIIPAKQVNFADAARRSMISSNTSEIEKEADGGWKEERTDMPIPRGANIKRHIINVANRNEENRQESPLSAATFNGLDDNAVNIPPDVAGTVGTAHIMTTLNDRYRVADKTGLALSTSTSIAFWAPLPGTATGHSDPHVKYDHYANRWILVAQTSPLLDNYLLLAVSQTNDPGGVWNKYAVKIDIGGAIDSAMDYPLIAFNQDRIVVSFNVFNTAGTINQGSRIYLFDKANVYAGGAISFTPVTGNAQRLDNDNTQGFSMCPTIIYEPIASPTTTMYTLQNWSSAGGLIRLVSLTGTIPTVTWNTGAATFPASAVTWNASSPTGDFAPQKGDLRKIASQARANRRSAAEHARTEPRRARRSPRRTPSRRGPKPPRAPCGA